MVLLVLKTHLAATVTQGILCLSQGPARSCDVGVASIVLQWPPVDVEGRGKDLKDKIVPNPTEDVLVCMLPRCGQLVTSQ